MKFESGVTRYYTSGLKYSVICDVAETFGEDTNLISDIILQPGILKRLKLVPGPKVAYLSDLVTIMDQVLNEGSQDE